MGAVEDRNEKILDYLDFLYEKASDAEFALDETKYQNSLDKLFNTSVWGFREILLVVIAGMKINPAFRASSGLYDCNPRAIYEGPIKEFFIAKNIPHRKSGPLNVAKATLGLNMTWAAHRRPSGVAEEVVHLVDLLEEDTESGGCVIDSMGISLMRRFIAVADSLASLAVEIEPNEDPEYLFRLCHELIEKTPDAGNTPQKISALLLKCYHMFLFTGIEVTGGEDRASVTSTTSKKPGDIKVYEVTVKHFDLARIRDSFDCISTYNASQNANITEVVVICRKEDCPLGMTESGLNSYLGSFSYQNIRYYFWEINEWIANTLQRMTPDGRKAFYLLLNDYINETNTAEDVKQFWRDLHS